MKAQFSKHARVACRLLLALVVAGAARLVYADTPPAAADDAQNTVNIDVTARKWQEPLQQVPDSVSVMTSGTVRTADIQSEPDAAHLVPNLTQPDFSARWLNFPYIRGIGSGQNSPAVTTIIDGVPQLSFATSNIAFLDVNRIEFLRGPQGSLYGRNSLGGVVNVVSNDPSAVPESQLTADFGSNSLKDYRAQIGGPLGSQNTLGSLSLGYTARDGYTTNTVTGHSLDSRNDLFGHGQLLQSGSGPWTFRFGITGEQDRDGDYGLGDLATLRAHPHQVSHDYEGYNDRDVVQPVFTAEHKSASVDFTSTTAWQYWKVGDMTDGDFSPENLITSGTTEMQQAWTQEFRWSSPETSSVALGNNLGMRWLLGVFASDLRNQEDNTGNYSALFTESVPYSTLNTAQTYDLGVSPYGQVGLTWDKRYDLTVGLRYDYDHKSADLAGYDPTNPLGTASPAKDFHKTSPQVSLGYHITPHTMWYATASEGFKAGGFNGYAPAGDTTYNDETTQTYETGIKSDWLKDRLEANLCVFTTHWDNIQLDIPTFPEGTSYIANAGQARSSGEELEVTARPWRGMELFGGLGLLATAFESGSQTVANDGVSTANIAGNNLPFAPHATWHAGVLLQRERPGNEHQFLRIDVQDTGKYYYDAVNGASQDDYILTNVHLGVERKGWQIEAWVNNVFNVNYIPVAFAVDLPTVQSGYVGESGAPRTYGVSLARRF